MTHFILLAWVTLCIASSPVVSQSVSEGECLDADSEETICDGKVKFTELEFTYMYFTSNNTCVLQVVSLS